jgi:hypothetical protein
LTIVDINFLNAISNMHVSVPFVEWWPESGTSSTRYRSLASCQRGYAYIRKLDIIGFNLIQKIIMVYVTTCMCMCV